MTDTKIPPPVTGVTPYINVVGANDASALYQQAFGAQEVARLAHKEGDKLMHCQLLINGGTLLMCDCFPEYGYEHQPSHSHTLHLQVDDVDAWWNRAVAAGLTVAMPLEKQFWGDRFGSLRDRFGVCWSIGGKP